MPTLIDRIYNRLRDQETGLDPDVKRVEAYEWLMHKGAHAVRGALRGHLGCFFGASVEVRSSGRLSMGRAVVIGRGVLLDCMSDDGIVLGDHVTVDRYAVLRGSGVIRNLGKGIKIGERSSIGAYNVLLGQGGITIGADCLLGPSVTMVSENHRSSDEGLPVRLQGEIRGPIVVGDDVWFGAGVTVLAGCTIGDHAIVAAGAVVTGDVPARQIVGGIPARTIRTRT